MGIGLKIRMGIWLIIGIIIWILLFLLVWFLGNWILDSAKKNAIKKWGMEERDYAYEKWTFRFYVIAFFAGSPILLLIALWQEFNK